MGKQNLYNKQGKLLYKANNDKEIDRGGEGVILPHPTNKHLVLKIYHASIVPALSPQSWIYLNRLGHHFVKPLELLYNDTGTMVGFEMQYLDKSFFRLSQLFSKNQCAQRGLGPREKENLVHQMRVVVEEAHQHQIVIGDFNPYNIFVNSQGDLRVLDVDSFETPAQKHSGRLLDEIRDFYYLGAVSKESDYFALAINVFRLLTYLHPYKGVHRTLKTLEERAVKKLSVLRGDNDLTIPSFYEPISTPAAHDEFVRIFEHGERFLISDIIYKPTQKQSSATIPASGNVSIRTINNNVIYCHFNDDLGFIKTENQTIIYRTHQKGVVAMVDQRDNNQVDAVWIGNKNAVIIKDNRLSHNQQPIDNFEWPSDFRFIQLDHIVLGIDNENIYQLHPDKIINRQLSWHKTPAWGKGFKFESSPIQLTGGVERTHYRLGESINAVTLPLRTKTIHTKGNIGITTYIDQETVKHRWFRIDGLCLNIEKELDEPTDFAIKQMGQTTMVFVPQDGCIEVLRANDFEKIDTILVPIATAQSQIFMTNAGVLVFENRTLYLINRN
jgi:serine/threonine protein kinase